MIVRIRHFIQRVCKLAALADQNAFQIDQLILIRLGYSDAASWSTWLGSKRRKSPGKRIVRRWWRIAAQQSQ